MNNNNKCKTSITYYINNTYNNKYIINPYINIYIYKHNKYNASYQYYKSMYTYL